MPKFMQMGLGFSGRPEDESKHFARYFEMGLKVKSSAQLQEEYLQIVAKRLAEIGLEMPPNVKPDYDMRVGYQIEESAPEPVAAK